jgi:hypothetical protein
MAWAARVARLVPLISVLRTGQAIARVKAEQVCVRTKAKVARRCWVSRVRMLYKGEQRGNGLRTPEALRTGRGPEWLEAGI